MAERYSTASMGETAENVAEKYGVSREDQDAFALESHRRAVAATEAGRFDEEIVPVDAPQPKGPPVTVHSDEGPRADTDLERLAKLRPAFREGGSVTAARSRSATHSAPPERASSRAWCTRCAAAARATGSRRCASASDRAWRWCSRRRDAQQPRRRARPEPPPRAALGDGGQRARRR